MGKGEIASKSNSSFSRNVFKRLLSQTSQTVSLCRNGLTLSQTTNFRLFRTERFADDNSKFDENGIKFFSWVENTVGKGEIARYEQFLLFPQCFQKTCTADT